jgi:hypothetical protein
MHRYPKLFPKFIPRFKLGTLIKSKPKPSILENPEPNIITKSCPLLIDTWSCGIHMLHITLATIYQGKKPVLHYEREDAYLLSQAHLQHELTGELLEPCIGRIVDLLTNPRPESSSKVASKKKKKSTKKVPPPLPSRKQADDTFALVASQSTLIGTMV